MDPFLRGCRRLAARGGVIHVIRRMVHELSSRSVLLKSMVVIKYFTDSQKVQTLPYNKARVLKLATAIHLRGRRTEGRRVENKMSAKKKNDLILWKLTIQRGTGLVNHL